MVISDSFFETADSFCMSSSSSWCVHQEARYMIRVYLKKRKKNRVLQVNSAVKHDLPLTSSAYFWRSSPNKALSPMVNYGRRSSQSIPGEAFQRCGGFGASRKQGNKQCVFSDIIDIAVTCSAQAWARVFLEVMFTTEYLNM